MLIPPKFDSAVWARGNFRGCPLGDKRRSERLEKFGRQAVDRPAASLPKIGEDWGGTRGIYRLLDRPEADLHSVTETHRRRVTQQTGRFLILSDTTHVDFGWNRDLPDAGPIGPEGARSGVSAPLGLAGQPRGWFAGRAGRPGGPRSLGGAPRQTERFAADEAVARVADVGRAV